LEEEQKRGQHQQTQAEDERLASLASRVRLVAGRGRVVRP